MISIHALRGEGDPVTMFAKFHFKHFNPRPPWGGRLRFPLCLSRAQYFNPRPPWGGRHLIREPCAVGVNISIHALRGEGDLCQAALYRLIHIISIHALRGEGDRKLRYDRIQG